MKSAKVATGGRLLIVLTLLAKAYVLLMNSEALRVVEIEI